MGMLKGINCFLKYKLLEMLQTNINSVTGANRLQVTSLIEKNVPLCTILSLLLEIKER